MSIENNKKVILVLSQRDIRHPYAGGAEWFIHNVSKEIAKDAHLIHLSSWHANHKVREEWIDGIHYIRKGNGLFSVILEGIKFHLKNRKEIVLVIDHSNTHQFFTFLWTSSKRVFLIHQLSQEIWGYFFGTFLGRIFKAMEELLLFLSRGTTITVSNSTKSDLEARGFKEVYVCPQGNANKYDKLPNITEKEDYLIYVGRLVPYKRVEDAIMLAQELNKKICIIGHGTKKYETYLKNLSKELGVNCEFFGYLKKQDKDKLIEKAHMLIMPSIREGWGIVVTEAGNLGTPSLVYPVNGTIEITDYGNTGFVASEVSWRSLLDRYNKITQEEYIKMREKAFEFSTKFKWNSAAKEFAKIINEILSNRGVKL